MDKESGIINSTDEGCMVKDGGAVIEGERGSFFYCLSIIGQIEGHYTLDGGQKATKYDHVIPTLVALEESKKIDGIILLINTLGGDVEAGLAIAEVIASMSKPTATTLSQHCRCFASMSSATMPRISMSCGICLVKKLVPKI